MDIRLSHNKFWESFKLLQSSRYNVHSIIDGIGIKQPWGVVMLIAIIFEEYLAPRRGGAGSIRSLLSA
jgi:hypothetical protein